MRLGYHEVQIERDGTVFVQLAHKIRAERVILNENTVHNVDMKIFNTAFLKRFQLVAEMKKIGALKRGRYLF